MAKTISPPMQLMLQGFGGEDLSHSTRPLTINTLTTEPLRLCQASHKINKHLEDTEVLGRINWSILPSTFVTFHDFINDTNITRGNSWKSD